MAMSREVSKLTAQEREWAKFAVLVRKELRPRARFAEDDPVHIHSLVIQSPLLRQTLERVFEGHADFNAAENKPVFEKPLTPFVHRWTQLLEAAKTDEEEESKEHLKVLIDAIKPDLRTTLAMRDLCIERDSIMFDQLWMIFEPASLVFAVSDKSDCLHKVKKTETIRNDRGCWFVITCVLTDWDGEVFGTVEKMLAITVYTGARKISELDVVPLNIHQRKAEIVASLLKRGTRFQELAGVQCMIYKGTAIDRRDPQEPRKIYVDGRIVIDGDNYIRFNPHEDTTITPFKLSSSDYKEPDYWRRFRKSNFRGSERTQITTKEVLTEEQTLTCRHLVWGFSLKKKMWLDFRIENISEGKWNDTAFDNLILPGDIKNLLLAFAQGQRDSEAEFDHIIEGKGKGMIIQLIGPPGVGKTLSAEAVAETMRVPLYTISAGDLGLDPESVQTGLSDAFQLARNWSAVLLLDEADVFMEKGSTHDLARNQLVFSSHVVFLQSLEYYQGTLFLTTNRVETFDPAFESRVHIAIGFDELSASSRRAIWTTFLATVKGDVSAAEVEEFVSVEMNGRQIKNVVKSAGLLPLSEKGKLKAAHVRTVLSIKQQEVRWRRAVKSTAVDHPRREDASER